MKNYNHIMNQLEEENKRLREALREVIEASYGIGNFKASVMADIAVKTLEQDVQGDRKNG